MNNETPNTTLIYHVNSEKNDVILHSVCQRISVCTIGHQMLKDYIHYEEWQMALPFVQDSVNQLIPLCV